MTKHFRSRYPSYPDDSDYQTNAPSYYDDLARKQKLIRLLAEKIWEYENTLNETLEQIEQRLTDYILENDFLMNERLENWDKRIDEMPEEMRSLFVTWLNDGTLEQIINHDVLGNKADQSELDETNAQLGQIATNVYDYRHMITGYDESTDLAKADWTIPIQHVLDHYKKIMFPEGVYHASDLIITQDAEIIGSGEVTIIHKGEGTNSIFRNDETKDINHVIVRNIILDGANYFNTNYNQHERSGLIDIENVDKIHLYDIEIFNHYAGIYLSQSEINIQKNHDVILQNIYVHDTNTETSSRDITISNINDGLISGLTMVNTSSGVTMNGRLNDRGTTKAPGNFRWRIENVFMDYPNRFYNSSGLRLRGSFDVSNVTILNPKRFGIDVGYAYYNEGTQRTVGGVYNLEKINIEVDKEDDDEEEFIGIHSRAGIVNLSNSVINTPKNRALRFKWKSSGRVKNNIIHTYKPLEYAFPVDDTLSDYKLYLVFKDNELYSYQNVPALRFEGYEKIDSVVIKDNSFINKNGSQIASVDIRSAITQFNTGGNYLDGYGTDFEVTSITLNDLGGLKNSIFRGCLYRGDGSKQTLVTGKDTKLKYESSVYDTNGFLKNSTDIVIPAGINRIRVTFSVNFISTSSLTDECALYLKKNNELFIGNGTLHVLTQYRVNNTQSAIFDVSEGDIINATVRQMTSEGVVEVEANSSQFINVEVIE